MSGPLVSIITPVLNARNTLEATIRSVSQQSYPFVEHIVIDGGSEDGSADLIKANQQFLAFWISRKDDGIYDAMNKGIDVSKGEWLYFLGADDCMYSPEVLSNLFQHSGIPSHAVLITGSVVLPDSRLFKSRFNALLFLKNTIHHQGVFYRRSVFGNYRYGSKSGAGGAEYKISADYDLNLKLYRERATGFQTDHIFAVCGKGLSSQGNFGGYKEEILIRRSHLKMPGCIVFDMTTILRFIIKRIARGRSIV